MKGPGSVLFVLIFLMTAITSPSSLGADVSYPTSLFDDNKTRFYRFKADDKTTIRYFVLKSSDNAVRTAFDACDVCWHANKGYQQRGHFMVCGNCGMRTLSTSINKIVGGCNPAPLKSKIENGMVVISEKDIQEGYRYFNFKGGSR